MAKKITQEELERDEIAETLTGLAEWMRRNLYPLLIGAGVVVVGIVMYGSWGSYRTRVSEDSSRILKMANQALVQIYSLPDAAQRNEGLDGAIAQLQTLIDRYPDTPAAHTALYLQGNCYFHKDELEKASDIYRRFIETSKTDEERATGEIALAYAMENEIYFTRDEKKVEEAKAHFNRAMELAPARSYQYYFALMGLARVLELTFQDEEALKHYERILAERPSPTVGGENFDPNKEPDFGAGLEEYARQIADQRMSQLSLEATLKLRIERLQASIKAGNAGQAAPRRPTLPEDAPTTPTASALDPAVTGDPTDPSATVTTIEMPGPAMEAAPVESAPVEVAPVEAAPVEAAPAETAPVEPAPEPAPETSEAPVAPETP